MSVCASERVKVRVNKKRIRTIISKSNVPNI